MKSKGCHLHVRHRVVWVNRRRPIGASLDEAGKVLASFSPNDIVASGALVVSALGMFAMIGKL